MGNMKRVVCPKIPPNPTEARKEVGQVVYASDEGAPLVSDGRSVAVCPFKPFRIWVSAQIRLVRLQISALIRRSRTGQ